MSKTRAEMKLELDNLGVKYEEEATVKELEALFASSATPSDLENDFVSDLSEKTETKVVEKIEEEVKKPAEKPVDIASINTIQATNDEYVRSAMATKEKVNKEEKVSIHIPLSPGEKRGEAVETVTINGYVWSVRKGEMVSVPLPVYKILAESMGLTTKADELKADRDSETNEALN